MKNTEKKYGLAIHTTSPELGLAISNFGEYTRSQTWNLGRDLSNNLHQKLHHRNNRSSTKIDVGIKWIIDLPS